MSTENIEQIRQTARGIAQRLQSDATFRQQVEQNPRGALVAAGLPENAVEDFAIESAKANEVQGFMVFDCTHTCYITCVITDW